MHLLVRPARARPGTDDTDVVDPGRWIAAERRERDDGRPWVFSNMVSTIDGAATVDGRSGDLGGDGDRAVFSALRAEADVILVGAETVRAEGYRLARPPGEVAAAARRRRGQAERPRLCIVTRRPDLGGTPPLLAEVGAAGADAESWQRPLVATIAASAGEDSAHRRAGFDVLDVGTDSVDLARLIEELGRRGLQRVLCEGGPTLLGQLGAAALVDEWNFTLAALVAGGTSVRPVHSEGSLDAELTMDRLLLDDDGNMFARYLTRGR